MSEYSIIKVSTRGKSIVQYDTSQSMSLTLHTSLRLSSYQGQLEVLHLLNIWPKVDITMRADSSSELVNLDIDAKRSKVEYSQSNRGNRDHGSLSRGPQGQIPEAAHNESLRAAN